MTVPNDVVDRMVQRLGGEVSHDVLREALNSVFEESPPLELETAEERLVQRCEIDWRGSTRTDAGTPGLLKLIRKYFPARRSMPEVMVEGAVDRLEKIGKAPWGEQPDTFQEVADAVAQLKTALQLRDAQIEAQLEERPRSSLPDVSATAGSFMRLVQRRAVDNGLGVSFELATLSWNIHRPFNYEKLPAEEQWRIDKALGILDR